MNAPYKRGDGFDRDPMRGAAGRFGDEGGAFDGDDAGGGPPVAGGCALDVGVPDACGDIAFVPSGRYRMTRGVPSRSGVRLFGVDGRRPVIVPGDDPPGSGAGIAVTAAFTGEDQVRSGKPAVPPRTTMPFDPTLFDTTQTAFYPARADVDFAIAVRIDLSCLQ